MMRADTVRGRTLRRRATAAVHGVLALLASACGTGPDRLDIGGDWQGTTLLANAYTTTLTLIQGGSTITGSMSIAGQVSGSFVGALDERTRMLTWMIIDGCEVWSGTLTANVDGTEMSGPVAADRSACAPPVSDSSGTITLTKS